MDWATIFWLVLVAGAVLWTAANIYSAVERRNAERASIEQAKPVLDPLLQYLSRYRNEVERVFAKARLRAETKGIEVDARLGRMLLCDLLTIVQTVTSADKIRDFDANLVETYCKHIGKPLQSEGMWKASAHPLISEWEAPELGPLMLLHVFQTVLQQPTRMR